MTEYVFPPADVTMLPIAGSAAAFPVRRVYCIGRNYAAHAVEMGHDPHREPPFFFQKNADNLDCSGRFPYPPHSKDVHHEVELLVALHQGGRDIAAKDALSHVFGYAISLDMTRRDLQSIAKKSGRPWEIGKAFEQSAPTGPLHRATDVGHLDQGNISLSVNGDRRQQGDLTQMIWKVADMICYLSTYYELAPGDVIMTGTPAGVDAVQCGDVLLAKIDGLGELKVTVT
jgi:fumarylpyruvate hydrolase